MKNLFLALRKVLFWAHLIAGVVAGLVILVMALTGTLISFERQINEAANGFNITVPADAKPLGAAELLAALKANDPSPSAPSGMTFSSDPEAPVIFQFGREKTLYANPYTGEILGEGAKGTRKFFQFVTGMHRWLALEGTSREVGQAITSAANLVFLFILISGLYIWIPKRWTRKGVKVITTFQKGLKGRTRDWNWHNVLGIWFAIPLLVLSITGTIMAYPWANRLLYAAVGEEVPARTEGGGGGGGAAPQPGGGGEERRPGAEGSAGRPDGERREGERRGPRGEGGGEMNMAQREGGERRERGERTEGSEERVDRPEGERREGRGRRGEGGSGGERPQAGGGRGPQVVAWPTSTEGWNAALDTARAYSSAWQSIQLQMPTRGNNAAFIISDSHRARPDLRQTVTVDLATAGVTKVEKFDSQTLGRRLRVWVRWIHTGEAGGWPGQLLAGLSTLAAVMLVWTGLALSWRRLIKWRAGKKKKAQTA